MWFKVKDNYYVDLNEVCAICGSANNRAIWLRFRNSDSAMEISVVNAGEIVAKAMKTLLEGSIK